MSDKSVVLSHSTAPIDLGQLNTINEEPEESYLTNTSPEQSVNAQGEADLVNDNQLDPSSSEPPLKRQMTVACPSCNTGFGNKKNLYRHQRTSQRCKVGGLLVQLHQCTFCTAAFPRKDSRQRHERLRNPARKQSVEPNILSQLGSSSTVNVDPAPATFLGNTHYVELEPSTSLPERVITAGDDETVLDEAGKMDSIVIGAPEDTLTVPGDISELILRPPSPSTPNPLDETTYEAWLEMMAGSDDFGFPCSANLNPLQTHEDFSSVDSEDFASMEVTHNNEDDLCAKSTGQVKPGQNDFKLPVYSRRSLEKFAAGNPRRSPTHSSLCPICAKTFGNNRKDVLAHIEAHVNKRNTEYVCAECNIDFQCQRNLDFHLKMAKASTCGFIDHECTGHHPQQGGHDHLVLCSFLWMWEQAQLDSLITGIDELSLASSRRRSSRWSLSAFRPSRRSASLSLRLPPSFCSEPVALKNKKRLKIRLIEEKLGSLSPNGLSSLIQQTRMENALSSATRNRNDAMMKAINHGQYKKVKMLLEDGADVNACILYCNSTQRSQLYLLDGTRDKEYSSITPLGIAAFKGHADIFKLLLDAGAEILTDIPIWYLGFLPCSLTVLQIATGLDRLGITAIILAHHLQTGISKREAVVAHLVDYFGLDYSIVEAFLEFAAERTKREPPRELVRAILCDEHVGALHGLFELGMSPNITDLGAITGVELAVVLKSFDCARLFIDRKADTTTLDIPKDTSNSMPASKATGTFKLSASRSRQVIASLYNASAESLGYLRSILLARSIEDRDEDIVGLFLALDLSCATKWPAKRYTEEQSDVLEQLCRNYEVWGSPLAFAAHHGGTSIVQRLGTLAVSVSGMVDANGSALCNAVRSGSAETVKILLADGAPANTVFKGLGSALSWAARYNLVDITIMLLNAGADYRFGVGNAGNVFIVAIQHGSLEVAEELLNQGIDINENCGQFGNALCAAMSRDPEEGRYLATVQFLLAKGADPFGHSDGRTAIDCTSPMKLKYQRRAASARDIFGEPIRDMQALQKRRTIDEATTLVSAAMSNTR